MNISPDTRTIVRHSTRTWKWAAFSLVVLAVFGLNYWYEPISSLPIPFADYWDDKVTDVITLLAALATALLGGKLTRHFNSSEPPHRIWFLFTLGWWAWVGGELLGFVYDYFYWYVEYPEFTVIDVFWLLGYLFFGISLYLQFRLIYSHKHGAQGIRYLAYLAFSLLITLGLTQLAIRAGLGEGASWGAVYLAIVYPVFDLFQGAAALWLFFLFGRGWLGRPWWGLIAFAFADAINIFFWIGGYNWMSDQAYYLWDLLSTLAYLAGYIITALAFLGADDHITVGMRPNPPAAS